MPASRSAASRAIVLLCLAAGAAALSRIDSLQGTAASELQRSSPDKDHVALHRSDSSPAAQGASGAQPAHEAGMEAIYAEIDAYFEKAVPLWKQLVVPFAAIVCGLPLMMTTGAINTMAKVLIFFGAQTFMNIYIKVVLSGSIVSRELHLKGYPAAFAVTGLQQLSGFVIIMLGTALLWFSPWRYKPAIIDTKSGWIMVLAFSITFTLNISLNNFSLSLLPLSINLIIRSTSPIFTLFAEIALEKLVGRKRLAYGLSEIVPMFLGVVFVGMAVIGKAQLSKQSASPDAGSNMVLGVLICLGSQVAASMNMSLAGIMGSSLKLNPIDTALYMALPSVLMLLVPVFFMPHPSEWPVPAMTDWQITLQVAKHAPGVIGLAFLSGFFAVCYNILTYAFVQSLSATHAAFASNFNKAATIGIAILIGLETVSFKGWGLIMLYGIAGNIVSFTAYSVIKANAAARDEKK